MSVVDTTDFYGEPAVEPEILSKPWFVRLGSFAFIGFLLLLTNFPKFLGQLIDANVASPSARAMLHAPINLVQLVLTVIIGPDPGAFFERAMTCSFILLATFIILLAIFCIRRRGVRMLGYGASGAVLGYLTLHILAWPAVALVVTIRGVIYVVHWQDTCLFHEWRSTGQCAGIKFQWQV